jgi:hypothetical protein
MSLAPVIRADLTMAGVQSGCNCLSKAIAPATIGVAMDVPLMVA